MTRGDGRGTAKQQVGNKPNNQENHSMTRLILLACLAANLVGCKDSSAARVDKVVELAKVQHQCNDVRVLISASDWKVLNVCGIKRYYALEIWCSDCSPAWKERKIKNSNQVRKGARDD